MTAPPSKFSNHRANRMPAMYRPPRNSFRNADEIALIVAILAPTVALRDASCIGRAELFDVDAEPADHELAITTCQSCLCLSACREYAAAHPKTVSGILGGEFYKGRYRKERNTVAPQRKSIR